MPGDFLLTGSVTQLIGSTPSAEQLAALAGTEIVFTSNVPKNQAIPVSGGVMYVAARTAVVMSNGELSENGTDSGIRLLADAPALGLGKPLQWTINPARATIAGRPINLAKWTFNAPATGDDTSLEDLTPVPTVEQSGNNVGPRGYPVDNVALVGGQVQFYSHGNPVGSPLTLTITDLDTAGDIVTRSTPRSTPELWSAFAAKADGAVPASFDTGQAASTTGSSPQTLSGGLLVAAAGGSGYYRGQLSGIGTRIGGRFVFTGGTTTNGAVALAITDTLIGSPLPDMSCHFVVTPIGWEYDVWAGPNNGSTGQHSLASGTFATPLLIDGVTEYEAQVWISGNTATIHCPDGTEHVVTDSRIGNSSYNGPYVFFESGGIGTDNTCGFTHVWASSGRSKPAANPFRPWRIEKHATATSSTTFGTANIPGLQSDTFICPPSGKVVSRISCVLQIPTAATVYMTSNCSDGLGSNSSESQLLFDTGAGTGYRGVAAEFVHSGLIPGNRYTIVAAMISGASDTVVQINPGSNLRAIHVVEPVY